MVFGMLVQQFGILQKQMPPTVPIADTIAMVLAMCRLHNFCIDERDTTVIVDGRSGRLRSDIPETSVADKFDIASSGIALENNNFAEDIPIELLDASEHFDEIEDRFTRYRVIGDQNHPSLPRQ